MSIVQISNDHQELAFAMLAAVLWIGNISFSVVDNDNHVTVNDDEGKESSCAVFPQPIGNCLVYRKQRLELARVYE